MQKIFILFLIFLLCKSYYAGLIPKNTAENNSIDKELKVNGKIEIGDLKLKKIQESKIFEHDIMLADAAAETTKPDGSSSKAIGVSLPLISLTIAMILF